MFNFLRRSWTRQVSARLTVEQARKFSEFLNDVANTPRAIWLDPDESGRFLWAVYPAGDDVLRSALFDDAAYGYSSVDVFPPVLEKSACVVAGARFDLYSAYSILVRAVPASVIATR